MKTLDFKMPEFLRITWVSQEVTAEWKPKLESMKKQMDAVRSELFLSVYPMFYDEMYAHDFDRDANPKLHLIEAEDERVDSMFIDRIRDDRKVAVLKIAPNRTKRQVNKAIAEIESHNISNFHQCLGAPKCCADFVDGLYQSSQLNAEWHMVQDDTGLETHNKKVQGQFLTNILLQRLGLNLLNHQPCSQHCQHSMDIGQRVLEQLEAMGLTDLAQNLKEVLSWSYSWSTLHGISELKTPLFKMIYDAQPSAHKYRIDWQGTSAPDTGLNGLDFPYQQPKRMIFSDSNSFQKGMENSIEE